MIEKPPDWRKLITPEILSKLSESKEIKEILNKAQKEYAYWEKFKYYPFPANIKAEEAWSFLKISSRISGEKTPIKSITGEDFIYNLTKSLYQKLAFIDTNAAGLIKTFTDNPSDIQISKYIMRGLTEEAIASSQIEGANTTHKVAKEMILSERKPRNKDEQMILNNYRAMQKLEEWKGLDLTEQMLLDLQTILIDKTRDDFELISGRFRTDEDDIVVHDPMTGEIAHIPPREEVIRPEIKRMIEYANKIESEEDDFIHPVVKATILHFWMAYLHPFADGNGRTARIIFYWYLLKKNYWLIQYISVSRSIVSSRKSYDNAFLYSEYDGNDLTYFLLYITDAFKKSIDQFLVYFERKLEEMDELKKASIVLKRFNVRQIALLKYFLSHADHFTDVVIHQNKHGVSRATANNDLSFLVKGGYLRETRIKKKNVYMPNILKIKKTILDR